MEQSTHTLTSDRLLELENVRQQFKQDCIVVFKSFVFIADPLRMFAMQRMQEAQDKDGFPVPISAEDLSLLNQQLMETWVNAKKKYFERMSRLGLEKLTQVKSVDEEQAE